MARYKVSASLTAENTFTDWFDCDSIFNLSISGTWAATITLQRSYDSGTTPLDVTTYTANAEEIVTNPEKGMLYRIGIKTGAYTSGTAVLRLSR